MGTSLEGIRFSCLRDFRKNIFLHDPFPRTIINLSASNPSMLKRICSNASKVGVTHCFHPMNNKDKFADVSMGKSKKGSTSKLYQIDNNQEKFDGPSAYTWFFVSLGFILFFSVAYVPVLGPLEFLRSMSLLVFPSMQMIRISFLLIVVVHVGEGIYAWYLAKKVDPSNSTRWFWQTLALGFFSLRYLLKRGKL